MIAIIDYGAGNLFSVKNAFDYIGEDAVIANDPDELERAEGLVLPGVGAFPDAMRMLREKELFSVIQKEARKKPLLGICLGMQMLFDTGLEFEETKGLGFIAGTVKKIETNEKIPHIGFNELVFSKTSSPLLHGVDEYASVYFVHSYMADTEERYIAASCDYGIKIPALVQKENVFGAQFHPEKSGEIGLTILRNFGRLTK